MPNPDFSTSAPSPQEGNPVSTAPLWTRAATAIVLTLFLGGIALYWNTRAFPWQFDDERYLLENPLIKDSQSFAFLTWFREFASTAGASGLHRDLHINFILRPVSYLTFYIDYLRAGFDLTTFRTTNILIHAINSDLVFILSWLLIRRIRSTEILGHSSRFFISTTAALLFTAHPLHTESVTYIVQRFTALGAMFYLAGIIFQILSHDAPHRWLRWTLRAFAALSLLAGMLSKEFTVTAPIALLLIEIGMLGFTFRSALSHCRLAVLTLPVVPALVWLTNATLTDETTLTSALDIVNFDGGRAYGYHYLISQASVVLGYLRRLFLPYGFNVDPDIPLFQSLREANVWGPTLLLAALFVSGAIVFVRRRPISSQMLIGGGVIWFFLVISVTSSIVPLPDLMAERRTYLPSVGIALAVATVLDQLRRRSRRGAFALLAVCVMALVASTVMRNEVWRSEVSLWLDSATKSPRKARPAGNLAVAYLRQGNLDACEIWLERSLSLGPRYKLGYINLARFYGDERKDRTKALVTLEKAAKLWPNDSSIDYYRGLTLARLGRLPEAIEVLKSVVSANKAHTGAHATLAEIYHSLKQTDSALAHLNQAIRHGLDTPPIQRLRAMLESVADQD
ncbi:MAG: tetratricopeptide repeat protein [Verrucomicrobiaceae bacterium]|nr:tetratricopeptide repeat protein [Verrucomicrobiaceae bacterium]